LGGEGKPDWWWLTPRAADLLAAIKSVPVSSVPDIENQSEYTNDDKPGTLPQLALVDVDALEVLEAVADETDADLRDDAYWEALQKAGET
jgi:hypothetical protein